MRKPRTAVRDAGATTGRGIVSGALSIPSVFFADTYQISSSCRFCTTPTYGYQGTCACGWETLTLLAWVSTVARCPALSTPPFQAERDLEVTWWYRDLRRSVTWKRDLAVTWCLYTAGWQIIN